MNIIINGDVVFPTFLWTEIKKARESRNIIICHCIVVLLLIFVWNHGWTQLDTPEILSIFSAMAQTTQMNLSPSSFDQIITGQINNISNVCLFIYLFISKQIRDKEKDRNFWLLCVALFQLLLYLNHVLKQLPKDIK